MILIYDLAKKAVKREIVDVNVIKRKNKSHKLAQDSP